MNEDTRREDSAGSTRGLSDSKLHQQVADLTAQRLAISEVLRAIANSPHDMQPIFDSIFDGALHLCRAEGGVFRLSEETGFRLVAHKEIRSPGWSEWHPPPTLQEHFSFIGRLLGSKSPVHIPDLPTYLELNSAGEAEREYVAKIGVRTALNVPMLRNDELIGVLSIGRRRIEPFTQREIELVTDFAAEAAIALEITHRER